MKSFCLYLILAALFSAFPLGAVSSVSSEVDIDYNYEYEKNGPYTKFSDWVPYKLHKWDPRFLEDFYELYALPQHYGENELRRDIYFLKIALNKRFRHPKNALCEITTEESYHKYRLLLFMHINMQIMRAYMRIGSKYDKRHLYFYNLDFAYDLNRSFNTAEAFYREAKPYWEKAKHYAREADKIKIMVDMGTIETKRYEIINGKLDFGYLIDRHLKNLEKKQKTVKAYLDKYPGANKPFLDALEDESIRKE